MSDGLLSIPLGLSKILSRENAAAAAQVCFNLFFEQKPKEEKKEELMVFILDNAEKLDDLVEVIPNAGPILKALVDCSAVNELEEKAADFLAEMLVAGLKGIR